MPLLLLAKWGDNFERSQLNCSVCWGISDERKANAFLNIMYSATNSLSLLLCPVSRKCECVDTRFFSLYAASQLWTWGTCQITTNEMERFTVHSCFSSWNFILKRQVVISEVILRVDFGTFSLIDLNAKNFNSSYVFFMIVSSSECVNSINNPKVETT